MRHFVRHVVVAAVAAAVIVTAYSQRVTLADAWVSWRATQLPAAVSYDALATAPAPAATAPLPATVNLAVPFTPQAPFAVWDTYHEEACEEASLIMVDQYYRRTPPGLLDAQTVEDTIKKMTDFEDRLFGYNQDTTVAQTVQLAKQFLGYSHVETIGKPTVNGLKAALAAGHPVIVPAAGRLLGNRFFTAPGPLYHMIVLRGYTKDGFITNDPGTRRGEGYVYAFDVLMNAMHDWDVKAGIADGPPAAFVVYPNP